MIWGTKNQSRLQDVIRNDVLPPYAEGKVKRLLGFNEPDSKNQANMNVSTAVSLWPYLESVGMPLASPVVTQNGVGTWMREWNEMALNQGLRVDYISVHWYGGPNADSFKRYMKHMHDLNGGQTPLLIREFAPADWHATTPSQNRFTPSQVLEFMKEILPWLEHPDQATWIFGYAWFPFSTTSGPGYCSALFEESGAPTKLAEYYRSVTSDKPQGDQSISFPTPAPTLAPSKAPTSSPTRKKTRLPTQPPKRKPTRSPAQRPRKKPTPAPVKIVRRKPRRRPRRRRFRFDLH
jgi:hypothetical protein